MRANDAIYAARKSLRRRRPRRHFPYLASLQHPLHLRLDIRPLLILQQLLHRLREYITRTSLPPDAPIHNRIRPRLADVDQSDGPALLFHLPDEAVGGESGEGGTGDEELRGGGDEVFGVAAGEGFEGFAEEDDAAACGRTVSLTDDAK